MLDPNDIRPMIFDASPEGFWEKTFACLGVAYREAFEFCDESLHKPEAHDLLGHLRRAKFETSWRTTARQFDGVTAGVRKNATRNYNHTRVVLGGKVALTASAVHDPSEVVRFAQFRNKYSRETQGNLFSALGGSTNIEESDEEVLSSTTAECGPLVYGILLHGAADDPKAPAFATLAVPNESGSGYLCRIDMTRMLEHVLATLRTPATAVETIADLALPTLKRKAKEQS